jgi:hypothetical protein
MATSFEIFLTQLAVVMHFSSLAPDGRGACLIIMKEGNIPLLFEFDEQLVPNTVLLSSPIITIPITHRADIYEALLKANSTIEETLSVKPDEDMLYLHRRFHPDIQAHEIEQLLEPFLKNVKHWKMQVEAIASEPPHSDKFPPHPSAIKVFPFKA